MPATIDFIFDFGSPNAYLSWKVLPAIAARTGAKINLIPCLLGGIFKATNNRSPVEAFGEVKGKLAYEALETRRFVARHGLTAYRANPHFPVNTLNLMRGATAAQIDGAVDGVFIRENRDDVDALLERDEILKPQDIAQSYVALYRQPRSAWTHELDLRPWREAW